MICTVRACVRACARAPAYTDDELAPQAAKKKKARTAGPGLIGLGATLFLPAAALCILGAILKKNSVGSTPALLCARACERVKFCARVELVEGLAK